MSTPVSVHLVPVGTVFLSCTGFLLVEWTQPHLEEVPYIVDSFLFLVWLDPPARFLPRRVSGGREVLGDLGGFLLSTLADRTQSTLSETGRLSSRSRDVGSLHTNPPCQTVGGLPSPGS